MENMGVLQGGIEAVQSVCAKVKKYRKIKGGFNMFQVLKKRIKNEKGLSLVELLAVIVILGIVAAIAIPAIGNIINDSRDKGQISDALNIISGAKLAHIEGECEAAEGVTTCDADTLKTYVDGKALPEGLTVTLNADKEWEISGYEFEIKNTDKFPNIDSTGATEPDLKAALDGVEEE